MKSRHQTGADASAFRRCKLATSLGIMGVGLLAALLWHGIQWLIFGGKYPDTTFLFLPTARFSDYTDTLSAAILPNPYLAPDIPYLPFTWVVLRLLTPVPGNISFIFFLFVGVGGLAVLVARALSPLIRGPWARTGTAYLLLGCSYPVLFCIDRGNIELFLALAIAGALYSISRAHYRRAMFWLLPAICFKLYPALLLVLFVRQRRPGLAIVTMLAFGIITLLSLQILALPPLVVWRLYHQNMAYFSDVYVFENHSLEGSASLWNCYKIGLISLSNLGLMAPVDFSYDGIFLHQCYAVYSAGMLLLVLVLVLFVCVVEKEFLRSAALLLLFFSVGLPTGGDYRLLYAGMALLLLILAPTRRLHDWRVLVLLALTMVPKKEMYLAYAGLTESLTRDVSIQAVLNPLFVSGAILLLLLDSWRHADARWSRLRLDRLKKAALGLVGAK